MKLKQKACVLKLWSVKVKDFLVFKSTVKMKRMKIESLGIERIPVNLVRCGGRNSGAQFVFIYSLWSCQGFVKCNEKHLYLVTFMDCFLYETHCKPTSFPKSWRIKVSDTLSSKSKVSITVFKKKMLRSGHPEDDHMLKL